MRSLLALCLPATLAAATWTADLAASKTGSFTHAGRSFASSSALHVTWTAPNAAVHRFVVTVAGQRYFALTPAGWL
jgi:hypothetical protein